MYFLETKNVTKQYANHLALDKATIQVPQGKIFGLLGPNGAGKTTLIRIINRITAPDSGEVYFDGRLSQPDDIYRIGYMPEERGLYKKMKVGEQAIYLAELKGLSYKEAKTRLTEWFKKFEILDWWNRKVEELSKGMQQKVQFIITVIHEPSLLIFDEPFSGFDPINADLLKREILELKDKGHTVIFSTHNMASVEEICDEIALINKSKVVLTGHVIDIRNSHKSNKINVIVNGRTFVGDPELFTVLSTKEGHDSTDLMIERKAGVDNKQLLETLLKNNEILTFAEVLPSMNDIFINTVESINNPEV